MTRTERILIAVLLVLTVALAWAPAFCGAP